MNTTIAMSQRTLGHSGLKVSPMGLGCWAIGGPWKWLDGEGGWGDIDDNESVRAIHAALDLGINFFDTAANYGTGHSERMLAPPLKANATKPSSRQNLVFTSTKRKSKLHSAKMTISCMCVRSAKTACAV